MQAAWRENFSEPPDLRGPAVAQLPHSTPEIPGHMGVVETRLSVATPTNPRESPWELSSLTLKLVDPQLGLDEQSR